MIEPEAEKVVIHGIGIRERSLLISGSLYRRDLGHNTLVA
jgi:hypothetical protein